MGAPEPTPTMRRTRPIVTEQPTREIWRLLRLFLDERVAARRIRDRHGLADDEQVGNVRKQARQVAQALRQAEEYFEAARSVGLATRPTILYYGASALARAATLVNLDGSFSIDSLRAHDRHQHHGLEIGRAFLQLNAGTVTPDEWFKALTTTVHVHETHGPWGAFTLFYKSLITPAVVVRHSMVEEGASGGNERDTAVAVAVIRPIESVSDEKLSALSLIQGLPDMWAQLTELDMDPTTAPGRLRVRSVRLGQSSPGMVRVTWEIVVNGARPDQRAELKDLLQKRAGATLISEGGVSLHMRVEADYSEKDDVAFYTPDVVDSIAARLFYLPDPDTYVVEPAALLALLFVLSMLARYFPDVWMDVLAKNNLVAELMAMVLDVAERKFPNLVLDQLTGVKHYVQLQ